MEDRNKGLYIVFSSNQILQLTELTEKERRHIKKRIAKKKWVEVLEATPAFLINTSLIEYVKEIETEKVNEE